MPIASGLLLAGAGAWASASSQHSANRSNIKLQRDQQQWEAMMSNTAVQRRAADIERAGGNRALAFTGGQEASTPSVAPPRMEPTFRDSGQAANTALSLVQAKNIQAQTNLTKAQTSAQETRNLFLWNNEDTKSRILAATADIKDSEWYRIQEQLKQEVLRTEGMDLGNRSTALANERFQRMTDSLVQTAIQQARAGKIDLEALENIASIGGVEAGKATGIVNTLLNALGKIAISFRSK